MKTALHRATESPPDFARHIKTAAMIVGDRNNYPDSLVALSIKVLKKHAPELVKMEAV